MKRLALAFGLLIAFGFPAFADKDNKAPYQPAPAAQPAPLDIALPGVDAALARLQSDPDWSQTPVDWAGLNAYYAQGGRAIWFTPTGPTALGAALPARLAGAIGAGMPASPASTMVLNFFGLPANAEDAAAREAAYSALLTATALDAQGPLASDKARGAKILAILSQAKDPSKALQLQLPDYHPFWRLYAALPAQIGYYRNGGWTKVPGREKIVPGDRSERVAAVKQRLVVTGELAALGTEPDLYDDALKAAAEAFQRSHGLNDDGVIGVRTIEEMNVSAEDRLRSVLYNLAKLREEGPSFEPRHLVVNIPGTELRIVQDGVTQFYTPAIVGRVERKTPILVSEITQVKFNPDWSVPPKIAAIDMLRHELDQPGYFAARNVHVYDSGGNEVNPNSVDWHDIKRSGHFPYRLKQDPGPENALGPMKLDFDNPEAVFIHGTSAPELFVKQDRFFSSGCVRVLYPLELAAFLLSDEQGWDRAHIDDVVKTGKITYAPLARPLPLHFVYRTAWVDEEGVMQFRRDVYGRDKKVSLPKDLAAVELIASAPVGKTEGNGE
jgi:murein L,D-transpeptidase YcbB/YkuD